MDGIVFVGLGHFLVVCESLMFQLQPYKTLNFWFDSKFRTVQKRRIRTPVFWNGPDLQETQVL